MAYTTINKSTDYFNTVLYTGDGNSTISVTGVGFQPDFSWIKKRDVIAQTHTLYDAVRGVGYAINSNETGAQQYQSSYGYLNSFDSDGYSLTKGTDPSRTNTSGTKYASWNWKANGAGSANTDGSISSTVSANTTAGFSIVKYTGTGAVGTIGHGLGSELDCIIMKQIENNSGYNWKVYFRNQGANKTLTLDSTAAISTNANYLNNTHPTSSVFTVGADGGSNLSANDMIAYCFAEKTGYSKFGQYRGTGNNDGPFIFTGFKPAFIISKSADGVRNWNLWDNKRLGINSKSNGSNGNSRIYPNLSDVENSTNKIDILSNGFKLINSGGDFNASGENFIYIAFAETPLVGSNNIPATAR